MNDEAQDVRAALSRTHACRTVGRQAEARDMLAELAARYPRNNQVFQALAQLCMDMGDCTGAENWLAKAAPAAPGNAALYKSLADAQEALGNLAAAKRHYEMAIAFNPDFFQAHANLANILLLERNTDAAIKHFQIAVRLRPDIAELHDSLGRAFFAAGVPHCARAAFAQALKINPQLATAHHHLAVQLLAERNLHEAIRHFRQAVVLAPNLNIAKIGLADTLIDMGETAEATSLIQALEALTVSLEQGIIQRLHARLAKAEKRYPDALAIWHKLAEDAAIGEKSQRQTYIAMAEIYDEMEDYPAAFAALQTAHAINPPVFEPHALRDRVDRLISLYPAVKEGTHASAVHPDLQMVFVLGMPRSGKTLTEQLLAQHPRVFGLDERHYVGALPLQNMSAASHLSREAAEAMLSEKELKQLAIDYVDISEEYANDAGKSLKQGVTHVVSTAPGNIWSVPLILRMFPRARFVHVLRDPLDTCLACFFKEFAVEELRACSNDLTSMGECYLEYRRIMSHWRDTLKIPMLEIHYEDMVTDPWAMQVRTYADLGLNPKECAGGNAALKLFSAAHIDRWKHYEVQLLPLINILGRQQ